MLPLALALHVALGTLVHQAPPPPPMLGDEVTDPADGLDEAPDAIDADAPDDPADPADPREPKDAPQAADGQRDEEADDLYNLPGAQPREAAPAAGDPPAAADDSGASDGDGDDALDGKRQRYKKQRRRAKGGDGVLPNDALDPLLVLPLQLALGVVLSNATAILWPIAPIIVATAQVVLGDLVGPNRGAVLPSALAGYAGMFACGLTPPLIAGVVLGGAFALLVLVPGMVSATALVGTIGIALLYPALLLALPAAHCGNAAGSSLAYYFVSEPKRAGDDGFRYPGVFTPSHLPEDEQWETRAPPSSPSSGERLSMAY